MGIASDDSVKWSGAGDDQDDFEVYPENALAVSVFISMDTQWQWTGGMESRRCGLNHAVLSLHMQKMCVPRNRRLEVMTDVQIMERSALEAWSST